MTTLRAFLTEDHRSCDDLLAKAEEAVAAKQLSVAQVAFEQFAGAMRAHFDAEEKTLFPTFEAKTGMSMGPTQVMRLEHIQMRSLLDAAVDALKKGDSEDYFGQVETLLIMMQQHNMKEENILYPMCDQHLAAELPELLTLLQKQLANL